MKLSTLYTTVPDYIEFAWVTAPNAAGQSISGNTVTTLTLDTEVADTGSLVSAPTSNQFTLPAGTYYYEAQTRFRRGSAVDIGSIFSLYNATAASFVSRSGDGSLVGHNNTRSVAMRLNGNVIISAPTDFELKILLTSDATIDNGNNAAVFTDSTAGADQRTTIKLWKLK